MHKFKIVLGDWSCDGHCIKEEYIISCNYDETEVKKAYQRSKKKYKVTFDSYEDLAIAVEYQNSTISPKVEEILKSAGIDLRKDWDWYEEDPEEELYLETESFLELFFDYVKLSLPDIEYKIVSEDIPNLGLSMGYGLFSA